MPKLVKALFVVNSILLVWNLFGVTAGAQRPPLANQDGVPYLSVNINPTAVPPQVNINPDGVVPKMEVTRMPEIRIPPKGCEIGQNFQTSVGNSIVGPLVLTYINASSQTPATLVDPRSGSERFILSTNPALASAIYLRAGQHLDFEKSVLYSGCRPE